MAKHSITIRNKTAHVKHLSLAGGQIITIAPTEEGAGGLVVTFDSESDGQSLKRFREALRTPAVRAWIERKEIEVEGDTGAPSGSASAPAAPSNPAPAPNPPPAAPPEGTGSLPPQGRGSASGSRGRSDKE